MPIHQSTLTAINNAYLISKRFFPNGKNLSVDITLRPYTLSKLASNINLVTGNEQLSYAHGPRPSEVIHWPYHTDNVNTSITITDFNNQHYNINRTGVWSLFKVINHENFTIIQSNNINLLHINLHGYRASFSIDSSLPLDNLKLSILKRFRIKSTV